MVYNTPTYSYGYKLAAADSLQPAGPRGAAGHAAAVGGPPDLRRSGHRPFGIRENVKVTYW